MLGFTGFCQVFLAFTCLGYAEPPHSWFRLCVYWVYSIPLLITPTTWINYLERLLPIKSIWFVILNFSIKSIENILTGGLYTVNNQII